MLSEILIFGFIAGFIRTVFASFWFIDKSSININILSFWKLKWNSNIASLWAHLSYGFTMVRKLEQSINWYFAELFQWSSNYAIPPPPHTHSDSHFSPKTRDLTTQQGKPFDKVSLTRGRWGPLFIACSMRFRFNSSYYCFQLEWVFIKASLMFQKTSELWIFLKEFREFSLFWVFENSAFFGFSEIQSFWNRKWSSRIT